MIFRTRSFRESGVQGRSAGSADCGRSAGRSAACGLVARIAIALALAVGAGFAVPAIGAADNVYWSDSGSGSGSGAVRLSASSPAGGTAAKVVSAPGKPQGIALNPAAGTIYWTEAANGTIERASLSGGTPETLYTEKEGAEPTGLAINAAAGTLYWTDRANGKIQVGSINGSTAAVATTLEQEKATEPTVPEPTGIAINAGQNRLFWTDEGTGEIREGTLGGTATAPTLSEVKTLYKEPAGSLPSGIAFDSAKSMLYWTDQGKGEVREAPLVPGAPTKLYLDPALAPSKPVSEPPATESMGTEPPATAAPAPGPAPRGLTLDVPLGTLYWGDMGTGVLRVGAFGGEVTTPAGNLFGEEGAAPAYPVVLAAPTGEGAPQITGPYTMGQTLVCGTGKWGQNSPGAGFYRAPQSFSYQWDLNGTAIAGATTQSYTPAVEGSYTCVVTATNAAGSSSQTSPVAGMKAVAPTATITSPTTGGSYEQGAVVPTAFACTEGAGGPGLASCLDSNGTLGPAGHLNTATVGSFTYTVTASSLDGEKATASITYTVTAKVTPPPVTTPPPAKPKKLSITITNSKATVNGRKTHVTIACKGGKECTGTLSLTHVSVVSKKGVRTTSELLFARKPYSIAKGTQKVITVKISAKAQKMLKRASGHHVVLRVRATLKGGAVKRRNVTFHLA